MLLDNITFIMKSFGKELLKEDISILMDAIHSSVIIIKLDFFILNNSSSIRR